LSPLFIVYLFQIYIIKMLSIAKCKVADALDSTLGIPTDITFQVQDVQGGIQEFRAHKNFLALVSEVFKTRFVGSLRETSDILDVQGTTTQSFETMINFIYHKDCHLDSKSVEEIFEVANIAEMYDIAGLMDEVNKAVERIPVTISNVADLVCAAEQYAMFSSVSMSLLRSCVKFLFSQLHTHVLDFSGLIFSPQHEKVVLKLHDHLLEKPLPCCFQCKKFLWNNCHVPYEHHFCGPPPPSWFNLMPPLVPVGPPWLDLEDIVGHVEEEDFLWTYQFITKKPNRNQDFHCMVFSFVIVF
jgi:hypothetical protein